MEELAKGKTSDWRNIKEYILLMAGFTHPYYLGSSRLKNYYYEITDMLTLMPMGSPFIKPLEKVIISNGNLCEGTIVTGGWTEGILLIYSKSIGVLSLLLALNKKADFDEIVSFTRKYFFLEDYDKQVITVPHNPGEENCQNQDSSG
jgi:hypothetical protein